MPRPLPALLFDCTHDNETPAQKRHPADALSSAALVSAAVCAIGSVRGYDIFVPENPSVVFENRPYVPFGAGVGGDGVAVNPGMGRARRILNDLHRMLAVQGYTEVRAAQQGVFLLLLLLQLMHGHEHTLVRHRLPGT